MARAVSAFHTAPVSAFHIAKFASRLLEVSLSTTTSRSNYLRNFIKHFLYATMAPKKSKRTADSINSRLALVMKSGKYVRCNTTECAEY